MTDFATMTEQEMELAEVLRQKTEWRVTPGGLKYWPALDTFREILKQRETLAEEARTAVESLVPILATMAETEFPPGVEASMGVDWVSSWRARAQKALSLGREALRS